MCPHRSLSPPGSLHRVQPALGIDKPLETKSEAAVSRPDQSLRLVPRPCGQASNPAPLPRFIAHMETMTEVGAAPEG